MASGWGASERSSVSQQRVSEKGFASLVSSGKFGEVIGGLTSLRWDYDPHCCHMEKREQEVSDGRPN